MTKRLYERIVSSLQGIKREKVCILNGGLRKGSEYYYFESYKYTLSSGDVFLFPEDKIICIKKVI